VPRSHPLHAAEGGRVVTAVSWPNGRRFAFTIFDDTDWATKPRVAPIYSLLGELQMRATKSVWVRGNRTGLNEGSTCEDPEYVEWLLELQREGFEIGLHNVAPGTSNRAQIGESLTRFRELFGDGMIAHANHVGCDEGIYWGDARLTGWRRAVYRRLTAGTRATHRGHIEGDPLFWGDLCRSQVRYVRNFVFPHLNTLAMCPLMPYHDPARPWVNFWFAGADGGSCRSFLENFTRDAIDRLEDEGGLCIAYVHFGAKFARDGEVLPEVRAVLEYVAAKPGWFPHVSQALDFLRGDATPEQRRIPQHQLRRLETRWLLTRVADGARRRFRAVPHRKPQACEAK
jgi:hypothetical protein